ATAPAEPEAPRTPFALPPAEAHRVPPTAAEADASLPGRHDSVRTEPGADHHTAPQQHPTPTGRRRARSQPQAPAGGAMPDAPPGWGDDLPDDGGIDPRAVGDGTSGQHAATQDEAAPGQSGASTSQGTGSVALPMPAFEEPAAEQQSAARAAEARVAPPLPAEAPVPADASQGRAFSVRTLGQGVPFSQQIAEKQNQTLGAGRRRKLGTRSAEGERPEQAAGAARPHPQTQGAPAQAQPQGQSPTQGQTQAQNGSLLPAERSEGRSYAIGAPLEGAEGPEPLDGPGGAVEVANRPQPQPVDDELPPEPLDNPRRLLVWPAPDVSTQQALSDRGYRPVVVHSREEVDAQIAAFPAALFVDPLTGPITRTALQSLRQAAVAAEVPVLVTAGLGQATREAAYGADPAILLKALAPRDSEQHPSRVLLIEEHEEIALALTATLERRGMQVARAGADTDAVTLATQMRPNLVVMDLMQVRRRRAGIIDWLRANGQLNRTPLVVYTSAGLDRAELPRLSSGETVLFLAERSTSNEVQSRIVDLLAKIGTN
ncbi:hypothetical protein AB0M96_28440, partial [Streptomyces sp. NPDC051098]